MKNIALWCVGAFIAFLIFVIAKLPAAQVVYRLDLPNTIAVTGVSGTIWSGSANQVVIDGLPIDNVRWSLSPWAMFIGRLSADLNGGNIRDPESAAIDGPLSVSLFDFTTMRTENLTLYLPSDRMIAKARLPIRVNMGGRFRLRIEQLAFTPECSTLQGYGEWLNASIVLPQGPTSLGNFTAKLSCSGEDIQMEVQEPNTLGLSFVSVMSPDLSRFKVQGKFKPEASLPQEIHQAGRFFGSPGADGYTPINL